MAFLWLECFPLQLATGATPAPNPTGKTVLGNQPDDSAIVNRKRRAAPFGAGRTRTQVHIL